MRTLFAVAKSCLEARDLEEKLALTEEAARDWAAGRLRVRDGEAVEPIGAPGRPERPLLVPPRELAGRGLGSAEGRAALIHAVAHIELNAIDLAWDAVYRFRGLPDAYYGDWVRVAREEAYHFGLMRERLRTSGRDYGDFPAHNGLWQAARLTAGDPLRRMALVPRVFEARGLDVTPGMIERLRAAGDEATAERLGVILREEVGHVAAGSRWFRYLCTRRGLDPTDTYLKLVEAEMPGVIRGPLNREARRAAGFSDGELERLEGLCAGRLDSLQAPGGV